MTAAPRPALVPPPPPDPDDGYGEIRRGVRLFNALQERMTRRVNPWVWEAMALELHEVVDRYADATQAIRPRIKPVTDTPA